MLSDYDDRPIKSDPPHPGDRVKLFGTHKFSGYTGVYLSDGNYLYGEKRPRVKIDHVGTITFVTDPENQMRKL